MATRRFEGARLEALRRAGNVHRARLAGCLERPVTTTTIANWESGKTEPDASRLIQIADYFGMPVEYFFGSGV